MLHLYCVRRAGEPPPPDGLTGVDGTPVQVVEEGPLAAWVSGAEPLPPTLERIEAHDRVIRHAMRTETPVPVRYGASFGEESRVRDALAGRAEELLGTLERVRGRVEMGVTVPWDEEEARASAAEACADPCTPPGAPASGREYLERKRAEVRREELLRQRAAGELDRVAVLLGPGWGEERRILLPAPGVAGSVAHLVPRRSLGEYRTRFRAAADGWPGLKLTGPWPPYSFVG